MKLKTLFWFILTIGICKVSVASSEINQISRYMTVDNKPRHEQVYLMSQVVQVRFPQNIQAIGVAINYLLRFSGYSLVSEKKMQKPMRLMLLKPLPVIDRDLGPMTLKDALTVLAGESFKLKIDPLNREIAFELNPGYQKYLRG